MYVSKNKKFDFGRPWFSQNMDHWCTAYSLHKTIEARLTPCPKCHKVFLKSGCQRPFERYMYIHVHFQPLNLSTTCRYCTCTVCLVHLSYRVPKLEFRSARAASWCMQFLDPEVEPGCVGKLRLQGVRIYYFYCPWRVSPAKIRYPAEISIRPIFGRKRPDFEKYF